jgi:hypothetical protein
MQVSRRYPEEPHRFLICDADSAVVSVQAAGVTRMRGRCSDCRRDITWIGAAATSVSLVEYVCGWCALGRINASTSAS